MHYSSVSQGESDYMKEQLLTIPTKKLERCPIQLYPVCRETVDYYMLRDTIKDVGILQPFLVRPISDVYEVICGLHGFECAIDLMFKDVPCVVHNMSDEDVLRTQMILEANLAGPENCIRRLLRIIAIEDTTVEKLAFSVHKHPDWIRRLLRLDKLSDNWKHVNLNVAIELAKLPIHKQDEFLGLGDELPESEFVEIVRSCVREMRMKYFIDRRSCNAEVKPYPRKMGVLKDEYLNGTNAATVLMRANAQTALEGWNACIEWVISMDEYTMAERIARRKRAENLEARKERQRILELELRRTYEQRTDDSNDPSCFPTKD